METVDEPSSNPVSNHGFWAWPIRLLKGLCLIPVYLFFVAPLFIVLSPIAIASLFWVVWFVVDRDRQQRRLRRLLQSQGRFIAWPDLEPDLIAGRGTLIIEQQNKFGGRFWWTSEDLVALSPYQIPASNELNFCTPGAKPNPFVRWCRERFLDDTHGTALLTDPSLELQDELPDDFGWAGFFQERYPGLSAVDTVLKFKGEGKPQAIDELA